MPIGGWENINMFRVCVLASGSQGNSVLIAGQTTNLLVDAGLSGKQIENRLTNAGIEVEKINAILVTHEHGDHIAGVGVLARRYRIPVYIDEATYAAARERIGECPTIKLLDSGTFAIGEFTCASFPVSHDAANPLGFSISAGNAQVMLMTDTGRVTQYLRMCAGESDVLILESNYEDKLLVDSPRPWANKQRISGSRGHLSNADAAAFLRELRGTRVRDVFLAHISVDHNTEEHVLQRIQEEPGLPRLLMTYPDRISEWVVCNVTDRSSMLDPGSSSIKHQVSSIEKES